MNRNPLHAALRRLRSRLGRWPDSFLWDCDGVVHIGANTGQERDMYHRLGLRVLWVEPIPSVFAQLRENLTDIMRVLRVNLQKTASRRVEKFSG